MKNLKKFLEEVKPPEPPEEEQDNQIASKQKRQMQIKKQVLLKKMQAVRAGAGADIVASHTPEGEMVEATDKAFEYVKKQIAADIVKKKGDTSKSDDRYAYESKLWDEVAANLTELGELNDADFKVEGYQRNPEKGEAAAKKADTRTAKQKRMDSPDKGINSPAFQEFMRSRGM